MATLHENIGKELSSKLSDIDKAYLAGLFDGEGCVTATVDKKKYFSKREEKEKMSCWGRLYFVISSKDHLLLELIKTIIGFGKVYRGKKRVYSYRITDRKQVLNMVNALIPFAKLKTEYLQLSKDAVLFMLQRKYRSRWSKEELVFFRKEFVLPLQKLLPSGEKRGRPSQYSFEELLSRCT